VVELKPDTPDVACVKRHQVVWRPRSLRAIKIGGSRLHLGFEGSAKWLRL
jgi:hypothetical protein